MQIQTVTNGDIEIQVQRSGSRSAAKPMILCVHGWPELAYSWRHQVEYFAERGYAVAAMDVRGYGGSSKPADIPSYSMTELAGDVAMVARAISERPVTLLGHDWGAPIVYNTALLHPDAIGAVAGLSVPFTPPSDTSSLELWRNLYAGRFFYQLYFQTPELVESELEADVDRALRCIYFALSGDAPVDEWLKHKPASAGLLDELAAPKPMPAWMSEEDLAVYVAAFEAGGFRGPINRYRAQPIDVPQLESVRGQRLTQPACFIGGERDAVRHFVTGMDMYADPGANCDDFRGSTIIPEAGHWVQQEAPAATNAALEQFFESL